MFRRVGRAMLRGLFSHAAGRHVAIGKELRRSITWWLTILRRGIAERRVIPRQPVQAPVLIWTDARAVPPRLAAVMLLDSRLVLRRRASQSEPDEAIRARVLATTPPYLPVGTLASERTCLRARKAVRAT